MDRDVIQAFFVAFVVTAVIMSVVLIYVTVV